MHPILRNTLAVVAGIIVGMFTNMGTLQLGMSLFGAPEGVDLNDINSINAHIHEYSLLQILVPFLAHALGTLVGAFVVAKLAATQHMVLALLIGVVFLIGGIGAVMMIPNAPLWFDAADLLLAYIPMGWIGGKLGKPK